MSTTTTDSITTDSLINDLDNLSVQESPTTTTSPQNTTPTTKTKTITNSIINNLNNLSVQESPTTTTTSPQNTTPTTQNQTYHFKNQDYQHITGIAHDAQQIMSKHRCEQDQYHPECPARISCITQAFATASLFPNSDVCTNVPIRPATDEEIHANGRGHSLKHIAYVEKICDTCMNNSSQCCTNYPGGVGFSETDLVILVTTNNTDICRRTEPPPPAYAGVSLNLFL